MSYSTVRDLLMLSEQVHHQAATLFQQLREGTQKEQVDLVMQLLAAHEEHQAEAMVRLCQDSPAAVLSEWHQIEPGGLPEALGDSGVCHDDMSVDEVVQLACRISDYLSGLYRQVASEAASTGVRELFTSLVDFEKNQKIAAVRAALSANDW
ncbi:hypothetical protein [Parathalassolituus penaei]|uniref:Uncharacterized protein n=1 Tax=Parathalassolituus penaei TaxID=2997323 RepID=A0A9X3EH91_9GAMM|nr:hypothetical protein [Parathalassolituus penaei]MCY0967170.1 hypothetical protein [Parathalassolituus penaei]